MNRRSLFTSSKADLSSSEAQKRMYLTNSVLTSHQGKQYRFYDDLLRNKIVVINMFYATCDGICPALVANLIRVHEGLKDRLGKDTFMYSITLKPEEDDSETLHRYVGAHGIKSPHWLFLTGDPAEIETIRFRLFRWDHPGLDNDIEQHTGLLFIYNDSLSRSCKVPGLGSTSSILKTISWMDPIPMQIERAKRDAYKERDRLRREGAWARGEEWAKGAVKTRP